nr:hypothetical protein [uncultured Acinetobacter sp.]
MTEPVTATVLVAIVAEQAAQELGKRIGGAIADRIFGNELSENQALLRSIAKDVKQILVEVRQIYSIVIQIPDIVHGEILRNELYKAHVNLESNLETFLILKSWNGTLGYDALVNVLNSWKLITEQEDVVDMIWQIPKYADFLMMITKNQASSIVLSGLDVKIQALESRKNTLYNDYLLKIIDQIDHRFSGEYTANGKFLSDKPWIEYSMKPNKYKNIKICEPVGPKYLKDNWESEVVKNKNGTFDLSPLIRVCEEVEVLDISWNRQRDVVNSELESLRGQLDHVIEEIRTVIATLSLLTTYRDRVNNGLNSPIDSKTEYILSNNLYSSI